MNTAELSTDHPDVLRGDALRGNRRHAGRRRKPPLALRPLHRAWRRMLDNLEVTRIVLPVRGLPARLEGLVACQISDFHVDRDEDVERLGAAVALINHHRPEFVFLTGDYFSGPSTMRRYLPAFQSALSELRPVIGTFAIAGNHDHWAGFDRIAGALTAAGVQFLANESRRVEVRNQSLVVVGVDDLWSRHAEPARAFAKVGADDCTIVLAHNPDTALYLRHFNAGVILSGHTHGGVVRIPFYGSPIRSVLKIGHQFYAGLNRYGNCYIYTNRGLGTFWVRIRINCPPEVSRFHLLRLADSRAQPAATRAGPNGIRR